MIKSTQEQEKIVAAVAKGKTLKVAALAGTGKTSTLVMIANAYPERKGLYLAYNKALQLEAQQKFPHWIVCKTMHGLAYPKTGFVFNDQLRLKIDYEEAIEQLEISRFFASVDIGEKERVPIEIRPSRILSLCRSIVRHFQYQAEEELHIEDFNNLIEHEIKRMYPELAIVDGDTPEKIEGVTNFYKSFNSILLSHAQELWRLQRSPHSMVIPAEHDTYLKLYQLKKPIIDEYDYIMLDESQDANGCLLDILCNQKCQVIYVGDEHQQIYAYRGTVNAMKRVEGQTLYLTQSFRFGDAIAARANEVLKELQSPVDLKGFSSVQSTLENINKMPYAYLARTNTALFERYVDAVTKGYKCSLVTNVEDTINLLTAMYYLWKGKKHSFKDDRISGFKTWEDLLAFANNERDQDLLKGIKFIHTHQSKTLSLLEVIERADKVPEHEADIVFTTAHKAKGREWNRVMLADDFNHSKSPQEKNIYYVALTRAKVTLQCTPTPLNAPDTDE